MAQHFKEYKYLLSTLREEEKTIPLRDIISQLPLSIVITTSPPVLPIEDPEDSLIMGNEELSTIPKKESNEVIKSNVEDFVPIPSESEDTSRSDSECDLPSRDDFSPINVPEGQSVTFSNPLFDSNDDFTSSDDESLSDEDVPKDNVKIDSNLLFKFDDEYISTEVNPLFDKVLEDIESKDSYDSNLDEPALLVTPFSILMRMSVSTWEAMLMKLMLLIFLWILRTVIVDPF
nr:ribonuclease H-like domain-containing protein [Tanacetum cinerariifolium]